MKRSYTEEHSRDSAPGLSDEERSRIMRMAGEPPETGPQTHVGVADRHVYDIVSEETRRMLDDARRERV